MRKIEISKNEEFNFVKIMEENSGSEIFTVKLVANGEENQFFPLFVSKEFLNNFNIGDDIPLGTDSDGDTLFLHDTWGYMVETFIIDQDNEIVSSHINYIGDTHRFIWVENSEMETIKKEIKTARQFVRKLEIVIEVL